PSFGASYAGGYGIIQDNEKIQFPYPTLLKDMNLALNERHNIASQFAEGVEPSLRPFVPSSSSSSSSSFDILRFIPLICFPLAAASASTVGQSDLNQSSSSSGPFYSSSALSSKKVDLSGAQRAAGILASYGITFKQSNDGYRMYPPLNTLMSLQSSADLSQLQKQWLSQIIEQEKNNRIEEAKQRNITIREQTSNELNQQQTDQLNQLKSTQSTNNENTDNPSHPDINIIHPPEPRRGLLLISKGQHTSINGQKKIPLVRFKFNEGFTSSVREKVIITDF
ncbi:MAG: hypothetical protein EZS28_040570, partial [Streblomastix strix]